MTLWDVVLVVAGCVISGIITWVVVYRNRKMIERNNRINIKNELLRNLERRALYIWSKNKAKEFNLGLEHSHILSDIKRIEDKYKELGKGGRDSIPYELTQLRIIITRDIEVVVESPDKLSSEKLSEIKSQIEDLTEVLESIPQKEQ